jgi:hypothetical protein
MKAEMRRMVVMIIWNRLWPKITNTLTYPKMDQNLARLRKMILGHSLNSNSTEPSQEGKS